MSKQHCECYKLNDSFDNVECCFDMLPFSATMLPVSARMSNEISSFRQSRNKLNMLVLLTNHCRQFITLSVHVCGQHDERDAARLAGLSAAAETCLYIAASDDGDDDENDD